jgi:hypothetical protein
MATKMALTACCMLFMLERERPRCSFSSDDVDQKATVVDEDACGGASTPPPPVNTPIQTAPAMGGNELGHATRCAIK